jgi:hypothetical protein
VRKAGRTGPCGEAWAAGGGGGVAVTRGRSGREWLVGWLHWLSRIHGWLVQVMDLGVHHPR